MHQEQPIDFGKMTSTAAQRAAEEWLRLDREERETRRKLISRRRAVTRSRARAQNGRVSVLRVHPEVMKVALQAAGGDASRIRIVSETEVWVE
ncbi:hypothetical protein U5640_16860 [Streptomyces sp. SS7]|uniref:hypothetical protein n=1 Tax=Streptomyces sp. SS7 TaxID=3108485 RepID=UPI0030EEBECF